jgi:hypothetical protein
MLPAVSLGLLLCSAFPVAATPGDREVTIDKMPSTLEEFIAMRDKVATTPDGGAATWVVAAILYGRDPALGLQALTVATDKQWLQEDASGKGYKGWVLDNAEQQRMKERLGGKDHVARSYVAGTSPANAYALPAGAMKVRVKEQGNSKADDTSMKLFVYSTGTDSPRPILLKKNDKGLWKAHEWSSLQVGCRPPVVKVSDDL